MRTRRIACLVPTLLLLVVALHAASVRAAEPDLSAPLPVDPSVRMTELPNGLKCWMRANKTPPGKVGIWMHVGSGSMNEADDERGLAHFLEHMAFDGSEHFPPATLVKYFESIGLTFGNDQNAFTGFDQTTYVLTLPDTQPETIRKGLLCMSDFAFRLSLLPEEVDKERKVILEEARARKGASQRVVEKLLPILLPGSRAAERLPIGKEEVVASATQALLESYYRKWYRPDDTTLLVVGDVDREAIEGMVKEAFEGWPAVPNPPVNADPGIKPYTETRAAVITDPELTTAETGPAAIRPLERTLTVGDFRRGLVDELGIWTVNRRLSDMVQKGTAPFQKAELDKQRMFNVCTYLEASASGEPGRWEPMLRSLLIEMKRAREYGFLPQEFADAKKALLASAEQAARTEPTRDSRAFLRSMNDLVSQGRKPMSAEQRLELLKSLMDTVTVEETAEAFRRNFDAGSQLLLVTMPEKEGLAVPTDQQVLAAGAEAAAVVAAAPAEAKRPERLLKEEPKPGAVVEQTEDPELNILSATLSNGVRAHLRSMDFRKGVVLVNITLAGGAIRETRGSRGLTDVAALAFQQPATARLSSTDIRDLLTGKNVSLGARVAQDCVVLTIRGSPQDVEEGLRLAYLLLTEPRIEEPALKLWKQKTIEAIEARRTDVEAQLGENAAEMLGDSDPRFRPLMPQQVERMGLAGGQQWLNRLIRFSPIEVAVVGDIERDRALALTLKYLGSLPERPPVTASLRGLRKLDLRPAPLMATVEVDTVTPRAALLVGWRGADWTEVRDRRGLQVAAMILTTRLREELREKRGLTYSAYCDAQPAKAYPGTGLFAAYSTTDPKKAWEAADITRSAIERLAQDGPTAEEMETVHRQFANILETSQKEPGYWAEVLSDLDYHGTLLSDVKEALDKYTSFTGQDVLGVLGRYVTEPRRIQVIATPRAKAPEAAAGRPSREREETGVR
jgi:zinc protease